MSTTPLAGQTTVILGGAGNVGEGLVRAHLRAGAKVIVPGGDRQQLHDLPDRVDADTRDRLITIDADSFGFDDVHALVRDIHATHGPFHHAIASIGGWAAGKLVSELDAATWNSAFVEPVTGHYAFAGSMLPLIEAGGSYTIIQGGTASHDIPRLSLMAMQGTAINSLLHVLIAEAETKPRINSLVLQPIKSRARPSDDPNMMTADEVGHSAVLLAASDINGQQILSGDRNEYQAFVVRATQS